MSQLTALVKALEDLELISKRRTTITRNKLQRGNDMSEKKIDNTFMRSNGAD